MERLTGNMALGNWKPVHAQVRQEGAKMAQKYDDVKHLDRFLQPDEVLPPSSGGARARLMIGLKLPELQPTVMFHLPSGLLVARTKLYDTFNSNVVFGGVYHLIDYYTKIAYAKYVGTYECSPYMAYNRRCYEEYVTFRGSIYPEVVTPGQVENKQRDVETGEEVGALVGNDIFLTAATGSGQTESGWCLEEVNSGQELGEDKDKSETFGDQSPEVDGNDPNEGGSQDCQHTRQADKPQDIADLQEGMSISYLYETPKTVVVRPTDEFNSYGQPKLRQYKVMTSGVC